VDVDDFKNMCFTMVKVVEDSLVRRLNDERNGSCTFQAQPFLGAVVVKQLLLMNDQ
jgi:hypothetical protein